VEVRAEDAEIRELLAPLDDAPSHRAVAAERAFLAHLGGGCQIPIAAFAQLKGDSLELQGLVATPDGERVLRAQASGSVEAPEEVGRRLAERLLVMGARDILEARVP